MFSALCPVTANSIAVARGLLPVSMSAPKCMAIAGGVLHELYMTGVVVEVGGWANIRQVRHGQERDRIGGDALDHVRATFAEVSDIRSERFHFSGVEHRRGCRIVEEQHSAHQGPVGKDDIVSLTGWAGIGEPGLAGVGYNRAIEV